MKPRKKFLQLNIFSIIALALLAVGLWQTYAPLVRDRDGVIALTKSVELLTYQQIVDKVRTGDGRPTLVYFYASWCETCKLSTPILAAAIKQQQLGDMRLIFVAIEVDNYTLANYLSRRDYAGLWVPYRIRELGNIIHQLSPNTPQGIPTVLAFDAAGKLRTTKQGALRASDLDGMVTSLKKRGAS